MATELFTNLILPAILGGVGGLTRGLIGLMKALALRRKIIWMYYGITIFVALILSIFI